MLIEANVLLLSQTVNQLTINYD